MTICGRVLFFLNTIWMVLPLQVPAAIRTDCTDPTSDLDASNSFIRSEKRFPKAMWNPNVRNNVTLDEVSTNHLSSIIIFLEILETKLLHQSKFSILCLVMMIREYSSEYMSLKNNFLFLPQSI